MLKVATQRAAGGGGYDDEDSLPDGASDVMARWCAAEARERRGEYVEALILYSQGFELLCEEEKRDSGWARLLLNARRRMRQALGIELDSLDRRGEMGVVERTNLYFDALDILREPQVSRGQVHVWSRSELVGAHEVWPVRISLDSITDYYHDVERVLRRHNSPVLVMHRSVRFFYDRALEAQPLLEVPGQTFTSIKWPRDDATGVAWPPGRNQPCWCGSEMKYKRCCGAAALRSEADLGWGLIWLRAGAGLAVCRV
ncbi:SEC-C domain-containing protein [Kribbella sp. NPDC051587]|uniref:SEC-C domain-containing protein n=1 Tax=Kribbella sp. NPDC051587 TaxID=3364119 RepID=UPI0037B6F745